MDTETVTIVLPLPARVLSPNCAVATPGGRFAKAAATKRYRRIAREAVQDECLVGWERASVAATFYWPNQRRRDTDNAIASLKAAYDGLVDAGLLPDDDYEHMQRERPVFEIDRDHPRVELLVTRLQ